MAELTIRRILDEVKKGQIRIPAFQRSFVWDGERVAYFMDSLYKGYPVGSLLLWRTHARLKTENQLGPFTLPNPEPKMPVDYVLDGQQRITSIYGVFQTDQPNVDEDWSRVYYDFQAEADAQQSQFLVLSEEAPDPKRYFPVRCLFDTTAYRKATVGFGDELAKKADSLYERFKEVQIPVLSLETEDKKSVAIVFERVNRKGVPLDTLQLLTAWTWSDDFDLQQAFSDLADELNPFGFDELGEDDNLLLRCCSAFLTGDAGPEKLVDVTGTKVRDRFEEIMNGIKGAIDFLKAQMSVASFKNLPFHTILVPLSVFFAAPTGQQVKTTADQNKILTKWFWRCCFSRRYSSGVLRYLGEDIQEINKLRSGAPSKLADIPANIDAKFFTENTFKINAVNTKTFILMLAQMKPLSFISGTPVGLSDVLRAYNRTEFHHLYPRATLKKEKKDPQEINSLANYCFLSKVDNNALGGVAPSVYRAKMPEDVTEILKSAMCPLSLFDGDFDKFIEHRTSMLVDKAKELIES
jgi:hypothetical protein